MRFFSGVNHASTNAWLRLSRSKIAAQGSALAIRHLSSPWTPPTSKALKPRARLRFLQSIRRSRMCSARGWPLSYHPIGHRTVQSTCYLGLLCPKTEFTHCASRSRSTTKWHFNSSSSDLPHPQLLPAYSLSPKRMEACGCVLIIVYSTPKQWNIVIPFLWSQQR